jgi:hypothetical protein
MPIPDAAGAAVAAAAGAARPAAAAGLAELALGPPLLLLRRHRRLRLLLLLLLLLLVVLLLAVLGGVRPGRYLLLAADGEREEELDEQAGVQADAPLQAPAPLLPHRPLLPPLLLAGAALLLAVLDLRVHRRGVLGGAGGLVARLRGRGGGVRRLRQGFGRRGWRGGRRVLDDVAERQLVGGLGKAADEVEHLAAVPRDGLRPRRRAPRGGRVRPVEVGLVRPQLRRRRARPAAGAVVRRGLARRLQPPDLLLPVPRRHRVPRRRRPRRQPPRRRAREAELRPPLHR